MGAQMRGATSPGQGGQKRLNIADQVGGGNHFTGALVVEENLLLPGKKTQGEDLVGRDAVG